MNQVMCFAIPLKIKSIENKIALMEDGRKVRLGPVTAKVGDYLEVYADMAVGKLSNKQALETRKLIKASQ